MIFLVLRSSQDMDNHEIIPFAVHCQNNMKDLKIIISNFVFLISKTKLKAALDFLSDLDCNLNMKIVISLLIRMNQYN